MRARLEKLFATLELRNRKLNLTLFYLKNNNQNFI